MCDIMDAKYELADLQKYVGTCTHLMLSEQNELCMLLKEYDNLFDGTLGHWTGKHYHIDLKPGVKPYYGQLYPVPNAYECTTKLEIKKLCCIGVL